MRATIYILFVLSGFAGLIYQAVWQNYLKLLLGHSSYGQVLTLIIFMGGLGLGSFIAGWMVKRLSNPLRAYAIVELLAGVGGISYHYLFVFVEDLYFSQIASTALGGLPSMIIRLSLGLLITLPWAIFLGMNFPFLAVGIIRMDRDSGSRSLPMLYFTNSIGAAIGILATSYYFIRVAGLPGTLAIAAILNFGIGLCFLFFGRYPRLLGRTAKPLDEKDIEQERSALENQELIPDEPKQVARPKLWLAIAGLTGFASFVYEIGWIRMLSLLFGSSTHSFDIMVSAFIFGLAFGGLAALRVIRKAQNLAWAMVWIQVFMGAAAMASVYLFEPIVYLINESHLILAKTEEGYVALGIYKYLLALAFMFPASFCAGMTLPIITHLLVRETGGEKYTGYVYGWNTIGAIAGAALGGILILPLLQLKNTIAFGAILDMALGLIILSFYPWASVVRRRLAYGIVVIMSVPIAFYSFNPNLVTLGVFRSPQTLSMWKDGGHTEMIDGQTATISLTETESAYILRTNGKPDGNILKLSEGQVAEGDLITNVTLGHCAIMLQDENYEAALIGLGTGMTAHSMLGDPRLQSLDLIEIEKAVVTLAARMGKMNHRVFEDKRVEMILTDAKSYFYSAKKKYDVIVSIPSNPWVSGVSSLFTVEFYGYIKEFLKEEGVLLQWIQLYEFDDELLLSIVAALDQSFEYGEIYNIPKHGEVIIIASSAPIPALNEELMKALPKVREDLEMLGWVERSFSKENYIASLASIRPLITPGMANSDYFPYVDQNAAKAMYLKSVALLPRTLFQGRNYFAAYQEILEPERWQRHVREVFQREVVPGKQDYLNSEVLFSVLSYETDTPDWKRRERLFYDSVVEFVHSGLWDELEPVQLFSKSLEELNAPDGVRQRFQFVDGIARQDSHQLNAALDSMLMEMDKSDVDVRFIRAMAIYIFRSGDPERFGRFWKKFVASNAAISHEEYAMLQFLRRRINGVDQ